MEKIQLTSPDVEVYIDKDKPCICREQSCRKEIFWTTNPNTGRKIPVSLTPEGIWVNHFKDCTAPNRF